MALHIFNTLTRRVEPFVPREPDRVRMYTCGPTVYRFVHIGNLRSYLMSDWLRRALLAEGYAVQHVKNITDVGHMRQEMLDRGEDKMIAAALAEGKTPADIAALYTAAFLRDEERINILPATVYPRATEHVAEMVEIAERLLANGHAYEVGGNVYFAVSSFAPYGRLSGNLPRELLEGVRAEADPLKRNPADFALWKAAEPGRTLKWDSPWGPGFPGWHIECSAMSIKYLGPHLDVHTGGVDNIFPHHEDELAQSEACFGPPFVGYWVHGQHLLADGLKMAKSTGNAYTLDDLIARGFEPLDLRYLCLTAHYRARLNFTFAALRAARVARWRLQQRIWDWVDVANSAPDGPVLGPSGEAARERFWAAVRDDLHVPRALGVVWQMASSDLAPGEKLALVRDFDRVLGLDLTRDVAARPKVPADVAALVAERAGLRARRAYGVADALRERARAAGFVVGDAPWGMRVRPALRPDALVGCFSTARDVRDAAWNSASSVDVVVPSCRAVASAPERMGTSIKMVATESPLTIRFRS
ncbi:MAG: cysteine--tRNA ligase, partial [Chloroflexi bacterium]|nr:cysteine--tRNA ligase [Chloroflexota bacterium]